LVCFAVLASIGSANRNTKGTKLLKTPSPRTSRSTIKKRSKEEINSDFKRLTKKNQRIKQEIEECEDRVLESNNFIRQLNKLKDEKTVWLSQHHDLKALLPVLKECEEIENELG
jgi:septal ring factor EnvC (AmiA/AmiB activator)